MRLIDKLEKVGREVFVSELRRINLSDDQVGILTNLLTLNENSVRTIKHLREIKVINKTYSEGINELEEVINYANCMNIP